MWDSPIQSFVFRNKARHILGWPNHLRVKQAKEKKDCIINCQQIGINAEEILFVITQILALVIQWSISPLHQMHKTYDFAGR